MNQKIKSESSCNEILNAAVVEFGKKQFNKASITSMCKSNGISKGKLYHHFEDKSELYLSALKMSCRQFVDREKMAEAGFGTDIKSNLFSILRERAQLSNESPYSVLLIWNAMQSPPEEIREQALKITQDTSYEAWQIIRRAYELSPSSKNADLDLCADATQMVFNHAAFNAVQQWKTDDPENNKKVTDENIKYVNKFIDIMLYGIL